MQRFSLRDLFWLTLVVGLVVGWWLDRARLAHELERNHAHWVDSVAAENLKRHEAESALEAAAAKLQALQSSAELTPARSAPATTASTP
jgi:hypothetical protein